MNSNYELLKMPFRITDLNCTGCLACMASCPFNAISIVTDSEGFIIPKFDTNLCRNCGRCESVCQVNNDIEQKYNVYKSKGLIVRLNKNKALHRSASGGAFYGIASYAIRELHAVVVGAAWGTQNRVIHVCVEKESELSRLQNSKYVQSDISGIYKPVKDYLIQNRTVVFSGTPCQIAGLKRYLKQDYDNLITVELVCHGTPSPKFLAKELEDYGLMNKVSHIQFRTKGLFTRSLFMEKIVLNNGRVKLVSKNESSYFTSFLKCISFRESCYTCSYASPERVGDFTIGDCDSYYLYPDFFPDSSNSICILNNEKAIKMWDRGIRDLFDHYPLDIEKEVKANKQLNAPSERPKERDTIYTDLEKLNYRDFVTKYSKRSSKQKILVKKYYSLLLPAFVSRKLRKLRNRVMR